MGLRARILPVNSNRRYWRPPTRATKARGSRPGLLELWGSMAPPAACGRRYFAASAREKEHAGALSQSPWVVAAQVDLGLSLPVVRQSGAVQVLASLFRAKDPNFGPRYALRQIRRLWLNAGSLYSANCRSGASQEDGPASHGHSGVGRPEDAGWQDARRGVRPCWRKYAWKPYLTFTDCLENAGRLRFVAICTHDLTGKDFEIAFSTEAEWRMQVMPA
jgi:hypothetical protein